MKLKVMTFMIIADGLCLDKNFHHSTEKFGRKTLTHLYCRRGPISSWLAVWLTGALPSAMMWRVATCPAAISPLNLIFVCRHFHRTLSSDVQVHRVAKRHPHNGLLYTHRLQQSPDKGSKSAKKSTPKNIVIKSYLIVPRLMKLFLRSICILVYAKQIQFWWSWDQATQGRTGIYLISTARHASVCLCVCVWHRGGEQFHRIRGVWKEIGGSMNWWWLPFTRHARPPCLGLFYILTA